MPDEYHVSVDPDADNNPHSIALRMVGAGHHVLEVGCWSGHVTEHLVAAGNTVVGVEIDVDAAALNGFADRVHVVDLDIVRLSGIESDRFDVIVLGDVLEHLRDPAATLADLVGMLTDDGVLVVSIPNVAHIDVRLHLLSGHWDYQPAGLLDRTHLRWFTRATLRDLLAGVGFVATDLEPVRFERNPTVLTGQRAHVPGTRSATSMPIPTVRSSVRRDGPSSPTARTQRHDALADHGRTLRQSTPNRRSASSASGPASTTC
ncbi:MAG: class I SAM-dependent methyltransferase [Ilumatobacteraceae bacterium]